MSVLLQLGARMQVYLLPAWKYVYYVQWHDPMLVAPATASTCRVETRNDTADSDLTVDNYYTY